MSSIPSSLEVFFPSVYENWGIKIRMSKSLFAVFRNSFVTIYSGLGFSHRYPIEMSPTAFVFKTIWFGLRPKIAKYIDVIKPRLIWWGLSISSKFASHVWTLRLSSCYRQILICDVRWQRYMCDGKWLRMTLICGVAIANIFVVVLSFIVVMNSITMTIHLLLPCVMGIRNIR